METPPPPEPTAPAAPAKRIFPPKSTKKLPAGHSHWESAPIEELVAYAYSEPVTPDLIRSLKTPGMTGDLLLLALERLCQRIERYGLMPYSDRWSLVTALRTILIDLRNTRAPSHPGTRKPGAAGITTESIT
jgi:hypothetical protein